MAPFTRVYHGRADGFLIRFLSTPGEDLTITTRPTMILKQKETLRL